MPGPGVVFSAYNGLGRATLEAWGPFADMMGWGVNSPLTIRPMDFADSGEWAIKWLPTLWGATFAERDPIGTYLYCVSHIPNANMGIWTGLLHVASFLLLAILPYYPGHAARLSTRRTLMGLARRLGLVLAAAYVLSSFATLATFAPADALPGGRGRE